MSFDAGASEFGVVERCRAVVADLADIAGAQSPLLTSNDGGGDLPAGQHLRRTKLNFRAGRGIVRHGNQRVRGVESHADKVNLW